jgi:hypothetical protein
LSGHHFGFHFRSLHKCKLLHRQPKSLSDTFLDPLAVPQ